MWWIRTFASWSSQPINPSPGTRHPSLLASEVVLIWCPKVFFFFYPTQSRSRDDRLNVRFLLWQLTEAVRWMDAGSFVTLMWWSPHPTQPSRYELNIFVQRGVLRFYYWWMAPSRTGDWIVLEGFMAKCNSRRMNYIPECHIVRIIDRQ